MRRLIVLGVLLTAGCIPRGVTPAGDPTGVGVLVQATTKRCTWVVVGTNIRRVCLPRPDTAKGEVVDSAAAVSVADEAPTR